MSRWPTVEPQAGAVLREMTALTSALDRLKRGRAKDLKVSDGYLGEGENLVRAFVWENQR
jgi:hypothetical protein